MIELEVISGIAQGKRLETSASSISLGRSSQQTIVLSDQGVSRHHGEILLVGKGYQYRDLNSTYGTLLRRKDEQYPIRQAALSDGDELVLGRTDNVIRIVRILSDPIDVHDRPITVLHTEDSGLQPPERSLANDAQALRAMVHFDSILMSPSITTERQALNELVQHLTTLFDKLAYVAILERENEETRPYEFLLLDPNAKVRISSNIIAKVLELKRPFLFKIGGEGTLETEGQRVLLSGGSAITPSGSFGETTGICAPISLKHGNTRYLQIERRKHYETFTEEDVALVNSMVSRVTQHIENIELVRQNQLLNVNASLGVFAYMIGHDIKNYLFFGKRLSDIRDDPLSAHNGILRGIERARKLAQGMKELAAPGNVQVKAFSPEDLSRSVASDFSSLFSDRCSFEVEAAPNLSSITTSEDLLERVIWNAVMNAYHSAENKRSVLTEPPWVRIAIREDNTDSFIIEIKDNAGGIGPRTLEYMQRSFALIRQVYTRQEDLTDVVNAISHMDGFTNSVGLFFMAIAVNDMSGEVSVSTTPNKGSNFRILLPKEIEKLNRLLRF